MNNILNIIDFLHEQNINLDKHEENAINVAAKVLNLQVNMFDMGIVNGSSTLTYEDCNPEDFMTMLNYSALIRKNYVEWDNIEEKTVHAKIAQIKHLRGMFPLISLKFAKQIVEMSEMLDPNRWDYKYQAMSKPMSQAELDKQALDALRKKLTGNQSEEPPF